MFIDKRKVGRPKTTWRRTVEKERTMAGWKSWEEVRAQLRIGTSGGIVVRPYAQQRAKRIGSSGGRVVRPYAQQSAKRIGEVR